MKRKTKSYTQGFLCATIVLVLMAIQGFVEAADLSDDPMTNSSIELVNQTGEGPDLVISITMKTKLGESTLIIDKDGKKSEIPMSSDECFELWQFLRDRDVGNMVDAPNENPIPDQSLFIYTFKNGSESNTFSAYGVDFLEDTRYREIAKAIIEVDRKYNKQRGD